MKNLQPKMNINKEAQELKLYMFTVQGGPIKIDLPEDFKAVMAYNDTDALNMVRKDYPASLSLFVKKRAQVEVRKIVDSVNIETSTPWDYQTFKVDTPHPEPRQKTMQDFVYGIMFVADKFITNKRDRATLKRIINKINL